MPKGVFPRAKKIYELPPEHRIDDVATLATYGYSATTVSPGDCKKQVITSCEKCNQVMSRARVSILAPVRCHSCQRSVRDLGPLPSHVNIQATIETYGYNPTERARRGKDKVILTCRCGKSFFRRLKVVSSDTVCRKCEREDWFKNNKAPREKDGINQLDDEATLIAFGYKASSVSTRSTYLVVATCPLCKNHYKRARKRVWEDSVCRLCARARVDETERTRKHKATLAKLYPNGLPLPPKSYGKAAGELASKLEEDLGRKLMFGMGNEKLLNSQKRIDIYDPITKIGIEYNGLNWHHEQSMSPRDRWYHFNKMKSAQEEGIRLINIFEDEVLLHHEAVVNRLLDILGCFKQSIGARDCEVVSVTTQEASSFMEKRHVQGAASHVVASWGLMYENKLVAAVTASKHHRQGHAGDLVLSRMCFEHGVRISGGAERLFARMKTYAIENKYQRIVSWSDNRWSNGAVYSRLGFALKNESRPDYSYVEITKPRIRIPKQSQKKSLTGCPEDVTEVDWALQHSLARIWDCGKKRWIFPITQ